MCWLVSASLRKRASAAFVNRSFQRPSSGQDDGVTPPRPRHPSSAFVGGLRRASSSSAATTASRCAAEASSTVVSTDA